MVQKEQYVVLVYNSLLLSSLTTSMYRFGSADFEFEAYQADAWVITPDARGFKSRVTNVRSLRSFVRNLLNTELLYLRRLQPIYTGN
jgi:hypothetical protein